MATKAVSRAEGEPITTTAPAPVTAAPLETVYQSEHFAAFFDDNRNVWNIQPVGWVGEAPLTIHQSKVQSLGDLLEMIAR